MIPNDILLHSQIGTQPNCHQRGFLQQLTGADAETHSQTEAEPGKPQRGGGRVVGAKGLRTPGEYHPQNQVSRTHRAHRDWRQHRPCVCLRWVLCPCYGCVA